MGALPGCPRPARVGADGAQDQAGEAPVACRMGFGEVKAAMLKILFMGEVLGSVP
ncbi:hypothetical protein ATI02_4707 [Pseudomonas baetica]|uniref:Uncharacterized protein n=1 Tax=Pseudomonas baetica TaxID=674054 RepID=A0ABX4Q4L5_9PSED|nr:hypothetical protein ATI02_4707 [Pseudomonas baetica]